jgi:pyruvate carboxylase
MSKGVSLYIGLEAIGEADEKGMRTVMTTMNGQLRPVFVRDRKVDVQSKAAEKADPTRPGHVAAPFSGVVTMQVEEGATVVVGQPVASIEAMKMEAAITSPVAGTVRRVAIPKTQQVDAGDLIIDVG